jgi:hypothetical protein
MKKLYFLILTVITIAKVNAQCAAASPLCISSPLTYNNTVNAPTAEPGIDYGCLASQPNPTWFNLQVDIPGTMDFQISQQNTSGSAIDVDFIVWGPFSSPSCGAANLNSNTEYACSYSSAAVENFALSTAVGGQYYTLMVTNFSNQAGQVTITQTNTGSPGSGATACGVICPVTLGSGTAVCEGEFVTLTASTVAANATFAWTLNGVALSMTTQTITVSEPGIYTVTVNAPGCSANATASTTVIAGHIDAQPASDLYACGAQPIFDLYTNTPIILATLPPDEFEISYYNTLLDAQLMMNPISGANNYAGSESEVVYYTVENFNTGCRLTASFTLHVNSIDATVTVSDQTATISVAGNIPYVAGLDAGALISTTYFGNVPLGQHTIYIQSTCGIVSIPFTVVTPNAPFGISPQYFTAGQTLGDLQMNGQDIQWYGNDASSGRMLVDTPLPLSTPLADSTTYYATQTIDNVESVHRFPVLTLSTLGNTDHAFDHFTFYPNPVTSFLTLSNAEAIDSAAVFSILGQNLKTLSIQSPEAQVDLSSLSSGVYFVRITSAEANKTIRIIKE